MQEKGHQNRDEQENSQIRYRARFKEELVCEFDPQQTQTAWQTSHVPLATNIRTK